MRRFISLDQFKVLEWGLNYTEAVIFSWAYNLPSWGKPFYRKDETFYLATYDKICQDLPSISKKKDTIYRHLRKLADMGLLEILASGPVIYIRLTEKAKTWNLSTESNDLGLNDEKVKNSRKNIRPLGKKSEDLSIIHQKEQNTSEKNPSNLGKFSEQIDSIDNRIINNNNSTITNNKELENDFISFDLNKDFTLMKESVRASGRENQIIDDLEEDIVDFDALDESNELVSGIESTMRPNPPKNEGKRYNYPPFSNIAPYGIQKKYQEHVDLDDLKGFEYHYFQYIAWRRFLSPTGEEPFDMDIITKEWLNENCTGHEPVKKYVGVMAFKKNGFVDKKYHYIHLFNYDFLKKCGWQKIKIIMDQVTPYFDEYYTILKELYDEKKAKSEENRMKDRNKMFFEGYEPIKTKEDDED